jgi:ribosomal protein L7/L12
MLTPQSQAKAKELLQHGQKIEAIQFLCKEHNLSLADAKDWIQYLAGETSQVPGTHTSAASPALMRARVEDLLRSNNKIQAIKMVMDEYKISLKQAKDLVDAADTRSGFSLPKSTTGIVFLFFAGLGTLFLTLSCYWLWRDYQFTSDAVSTTGKVIDLHYGMDGDSGAAPVIEYYWKGTEMFYQGSVYSNPPAVEIGEHVELFINPDNPSDVVINLISERYILIFVFGFIGFVFSMIGYLGVWMGRRR